MSSDRLLVPDIPKKALSRRDRAFVYRKTNSQPAFQIWVYRGVYLSLPRTLQGDHRGAQPPCENKIEVAGSAEGGLERLGARRKPQENLRVA